jgi:hypothetical protein
MRIQFVARNSNAAKYKDLTVGNIYQVIGLEANDFRIINDEGLPYLYPPELFSIDDEHEPEDWIIEYGEDGERYSYPPELNRVGFFEDYFDGDQKTIAIFRQFLAKQRNLRSAISKTA